jgi:hypothetical protein
LKVRFPFALIAALAAFAIPAGSALASTISTFVAPSDGARISQNQTFTVDTTGVAGAVGVEFYIDNAGTPGTSLGGYANDPGNNYSSNGSVDSFQLAVGGWANPSDLTDFTTPYSITIDGVVVDSLGATLEMVSRSVTIDNTQTPLVRGSFLPASSGVQSGTFTLTLTPSDQNNVITAGTFSVDGNITTYPLTSDGNGHWSAPVDTVALGVPNGDLDIRVHLADAAGNTVDDDIFYSIANPKAPTITPGTLVAQKSNFRTAETQLEVGDVVSAYNMQADGYPAPTIRYLWNVCRGQVCNGTTAGQDGSYTIQAADVGATLTLVATASNASGTDFTLVEFGALAAAYVAPVDNGGGGYGDAPQADPIPAPTPEPPVVTPPVVTPPVVTPPVVTQPVVTPAEQKAINVAQQVVRSETAAVETAAKAVTIATHAVKIVQKKVDAAVNTVSAGTATLTEKKKLVSTVATLVAAKVVASGKVEAAKAVTTKAVFAQKASVRTVNVAQKAVLAAKTAVATGTATPAEKKRLTKTMQTLVAAQAVASVKTKDVAIVTKQLVATQATAVQSIGVAQKNVSTALTAVASSKATPTAKKALIAVETKLVTAKAVASAKTDSLQASTTQLAVAKQKLTAKTTAALKP